MSVSFYPCFPVANQKLHTKCLLWRRIKKNDHSPVSRTPQNSFYSAKSTAQIPFQHMLTTSMSVVFDLPPRWPCLILRLQHNIQEQQMRNQSLVPKSCLGSSKVHIYHAVGWVGKPKIFHFSTCLSTCLERRGFLLVEELLLWPLRCLLWWITFLGVNNERRIIKATRNGNAKRAAAKNQIVSLVAKDVKSSCRAKNSFKLLCTRSW